MTMKPILTGAFETALNRYIAMDTDASFLLAPLNNKVVAVNFLPIQETLYFCPSEHNIQILDEYPGQPDANLTGSLLAFGAKGLGADLYNDSIKISGSIEVGQTFLRVFEKLDIDPEEMLSRYTGDIVAHRIGRFFRAGHRWITDFLETSRLNLTEFLQEETRDLPAKPEADIFYRKIDELQADLNRLQKHIELLENIQDNRP